MKTTMCMTGYLIKWYWIVIDNGLAMCSANIK